MCIPEAHVPSWFFPTANPVQDHDDRSGHAMRRPAVPMILHPVRQVSARIIWAFGNDARADSPPKLGKPTEDGTSQRMAAALGFAGRLIVLVRAKNQAVIPFPAGPSRCQGRRRSGLPPMPSGQDCPIRHDWP